MRFRPIHVSRERRYALERDLQTGRPVLGIPVSNRLTDYTEYYEISEDELEGFVSNEAAASAFATQCGNREHDDRLIFEPGSDRGVY